MHAGRRSATFGPVGVQSAQLAMASTRNAGKEVDYGEDSSEVCPRRAAAGRRNPCVAAPDPRSRAAAHRETTQRSRWSRERFLPASLRRTRCGAVARGFALRHRRPRADADPLNAVCGAERQPLLQLRQGDRSAAVLRAVPACVPSAMPFAAVDQDPGRRLVLPALRAGADAAAGGGAHHRRAYPPIGASLRSPLCILTSATLSCGRALLCLTNVRHCKGVIGQALQHCSLEAVTGPRPVRRTVYSPIGARRHALSHRASPLCHNTVCRQKAGERTGPRLAGPEAKSAGAPLALGLHAPPSHSPACNCRYCLCSPQPVSL